MNGRQHAWLGLCLLAGCATGRPDVVHEFDSSAGYVEVFAADDGFASYEGQRLPIDAVILRLRQRLRAMTAEQRGRFVVHLLLAEGITSDTGKATAFAGLNRLLDELTVMGVQQAKFL